MKRFLSFFLLLLLLGGLVPAALAASAEETEAAQGLYELGLFRGVGTGEDGKPLFELDRAMTRPEAVTMLVRLLGKEEEAAAGSWNLPFEDVPAWARPAVGYAFANGFTNGVSETRFGGAEAVSAAQYVAFLLRALGYASGVDFHWADTLSFAQGLGLTVPEGPFTRGVAALLSYRALGLRLKEREQTLKDRLQGVELEPPMLSTAVMKGLWHADGENGACWEWRFEGDGFTALSVTPLGQNLPNAALRGVLGVTSLKRGSFSLTDGALSLRYDSRECSTPLLYRTSAAGLTESCSVSMPARDVLLIGDGAAQRRFVRVEETGRIAAAEREYESLSEEYVLSQLNGCWTKTDSYTRPDGSEYSVENEVSLYGTSYELALADSTGYLYYERGSFRVDGSGVYPTAPEESYGIWQGQLSTRRSEGTDRPEGFGAPVFRAFGYAHRDSSTGLIDRVKQERLRLNDPAYVAQQVLAQDHTDLLEQQIAALRQRNPGVRLLTACYTTYYDRNEDLVVVMAMEYEKAGGSFYEYVLQNVTQGWTVMDPVYHYRTLLGQTYGDAKQLYLDLADDAQTHLANAMRGVEGKFFYAEDLP